MQTGKLLVIALILIQPWLFLGCSPFAKLNKKSSAPSSTVDRRLNGFSHTSSQALETLDYILGHVREALNQSDIMLISELRALLQDRSQSDAKRWKEIDSEIQAIARGRQIYKYVLAYYLGKYGEQMLISISQQMQGEGILTLQQKQHNDLSPENFKQFLLKAQSKNWSERETIILQFDELNKISATSELLLKHSYSVVIDMLKKHQVSDKVLRDIQASLDKLLEMAKLEGRYFIQEALKYTYQDFSLEELQQLSNFLKSNNVSQIFNDLPLAIN